MKMIECIPSHFPGEFLYLSCWLGHEAMGAEALEVSSDSRILAGCFSRFKPY